MLVVVFYLLDKTSASKWENEIIFLSEDFLYEPLGVVFILWYSELSYVNFFYVVFNF